jgi:hemolysin III
MDLENITFYDKKEEKLNVISHGFGLALSIVALILLLIKAINYGTVWHIISFSIYGASLIVFHRYNSKQAD